jgi:hypothetical protein
MYRSQTENLQVLGSIRTRAIFGGISRWERELRMIAGVRDSEVRLELTLRTPLVTGLKLKYLIIPSASKDAVAPSILL